MAILEYAPGHYRVTVGKHNRVTIPIQVRRKLRLRGGSRLKPAIKGKKFILTPVKRKKHKQ